MIGAPQSPRNHATLCSSSATDISNNASSESVIHSPMVRKKPKPTTSPNQLTSPRDENLSLPTPTPSSGNDNHPYRLSLGAISAYDRPPSPTEKFVYRPGSIAKLFSSLSSRSAIPLEDLAPVDDLTHRSQPLAAYPGLSSSRSERHHSNQSSSTKSKQTSRKGTSSNEEPIRSPIAPSSLERIYAPLTIEFSHSPATSTTASPKKHPKKRKSVSRKKKAQDDDDQSSSPYPRHRRRPKSTHSSHMSPSSRPSYSSHSSTSFPSVASSTEMIDFPVSGDELGLPMSGEEDDGP